MSESSRSNGPSNSSRRTEKPSVGSGVEVTASDEVSGATGPPWSAPASGDGPGCSGASTSITSGTVPAERPDPHDDPRGHGSPIRLRTWPNR